LRNPKWEGGEKWAWRRAWAIRVTEVTRERTKNCFKEKDRWIQVGEKIGTEGKCKSDRQLEVPGRGPEKQ